MMDNTVILYLVKASISLALFYGLYMLILKRDTFFKIRRFYFLFAILFSYLFPLFSIEMPVWPESASEPPIYTSWLSQIEIGSVAAEEVSKSVIDIWLVIGLTGAIISLILACRFLIQLLSIVKLLVDNESYRVSSYRIVKLEHKKVSSFSFFNWIFVDTEWRDTKELEEIIVHEQIHVEQFHSVDVILSEILCICFWWNPFAWLLRSEMKINLEYLADQGVLNAGFDTKEYQYILLQTSNKNTGIPIINNFNVSQLKKRITMMNKKRTSAFMAIKYMMALPLVLALLLGNSMQASSELKEFILNEKQENMDDGISAFQLGETEVDNSVILEQAEIVKHVSDTVPKKIFHNVGKMPEFPEGEKALSRYIFENLKYPVNAQKAGIQGRIIVNFVVEKTGKISDVKVVKGIDAECDAEAVRVVKAMPDWIPGKENGKAVDVYFSLPIVFKLTGKDSSNTQAGVKSPQENAANSDKQPVFMQVEQLPSFPGGETAMFKYISENLQYPVNAQKAEIQGPVMIRFVVEKTGKISDVKVVKGIDAECDAEAVRVVKAMPKWEPGKQGGQEVDVYFTLPIVYKLNLDSKESSK